MQVCNYYRPRNPELSLFNIIRRDHFAMLERVYPERFQNSYGDWRPVIKSSMNASGRCGDLGEGFTTLRCEHCGKVRLIPFSCHQRYSCPSCDQMRVSRLGYRLVGEVFANVPHRTWVFTIPKSLRVYFRSNRRLLGRLKLAANKTLLTIYTKEVDEDGVCPGIVAAVQTFDSLLNWNPHIHAIVTEGVFTPSGDFIPVPGINETLALTVWKEMVFEILHEMKFGKKRIDRIREKCQRGFSINNKTWKTGEDRDGLRGMVEYIARSPISLARITLTNDGNVLFKANNSKHVPYPKVGNKMLKAGVPRNSQIFDPLEFLAATMQHVPNKGKHLICYYGPYSNKSRGMRNKQRGEAKHKKFQRGWSALMIAVHRVDPMKCTWCGGKMKIIAVVTKKNEIQQMLTDRFLWDVPGERAPPSTDIQRIREYEESMLE